MKILVYGAGVIGCELAHMLVKSGSDVTLLARGKWLKSIDENGLIIQHYAQLHTTVDRVNTIEKLKPDDVYEGYLKQRLHEMKTGQSGNIADVKGDTRFLSRITSVGLTIGCRVATVHAQLYGFQNAEGVKPSSGHAGGPPHRKYNYIFSLPRHY